MPETPSKSFPLIATIVIPVATFFVGMAAQYFIASRTLSYQEFVTATTIATTEAAQKNAKLKEWSDIVIAQYAEERKRAQPATPAFPSKDSFLVSREIAEDVCIFPKQAFREAPEPTIMDTVINEPEKLKGVDARVAFVKAASDYRILRLRYDGVLDGLKKTCGFLLRR